MLKRLNFNYLKGFILFLIMCCALTSNLSGCKKTPELLNEEYILVDDNGVIKCENYDYVVCLEKKKGKDFKILNLADIQLTKDEVLTDSNVATFAYKLIRELIEETKPDLILLLGDQGYGEIAPINAISSIVDSYNIPWAYVFGNHDQGCNELSIKEQVGLYASYPNCIAKYGPEEITGSNTGVPRAGNYIINIVERDEESFHIVRSLFMLNSGSEYVEEIPSEQRLNNSYYEHLSEKQLEFYKWGLESSRKYSNGKYSKSTVIEHMPITAYAFALAEAFITDYSAYEMSKICGIANGYLVRETYNGVCWKEGYKDSFGACYEVICCSPVEDGIFDVLLEYGSTDTMFVGHDHNNNFSINYKGIRLTFSLKTGYGCYYNRQLLGGTVFSFNDTDYNIEHIYKLD